MFYFRRSGLVSSAVPRIFLSSYLILRQSDFTPQALCFNSNSSLNTYLSDYRNISTFFRNLPINRRFFHNRSEFCQFSEGQDTSHSYPGDSTNDNRHFNHFPNLNNNYQNYNTNKHPKNYTGGLNSNSRSFVHSRMANHYDLVVLGGGPGGMTAAKEAAKLGKKTVLFDYVRPSPRGTTWGVGGTCVNVGCIPKKLMHYASTLRSSNQDRFQYGLTSSLDNSEVDWPKLVKAVQNHVKMLNFSYRSGLTVSGVEYVNAYATLKENKTVEYQLNGETKVVTGDKVLIAVGERPYVPEDVEGARELAITSDDLFSLQKSPGKTLVVGGSYVALECAGFLAGLGYEVNVSVRSVLLRGFDRQCADKVGELMEASGVVFLHKKLPKKLEKHQNQLKMDYDIVPGCVYTPFEYSSCGLSEEQAIEKYGEDNVEVYLKEYTNLELSPAHRVNKKTNDEFDFPLTCLTKVVCLKDDTIVGLHFVGPNAGEIMQGFAVLLPLKAKKSDLDRTVGIHPTDAESFMDLTVTKSSKKSWVASGGCAGGKCG